MPPKRRRGQGVRSRGRFSPRAKIQATLIKTEPEEAPEDGAEASAETADDAEEPTSTSQETVEDAVEADKSNVDANVIINSEQAEYESDEAAADTAADVEEPTSTTTSLETVEDAVEADMSNVDANVINNSEQDEYESDEAAAETAADVEQPNSTTTSQETVEDTVEADKSNVDANVINNSEQDEYESDEAAAETAADVEEPNSTTTSQETVEDTVEADKSNVDANVINNSEQDEYESDEAAAETAADVEEPTSTITSQETVEDAVEADKSNNDANVINNSEQAEYESAEAATVEQTDAECESAEQADGSVQSLDDSAVDAGNAEPKEKEEMHLSDVISGIPKDVIVNNDDHKESVTMNLEEVDKRDDKVSMTLREAENEESFWMLRLCPVPFQGFQQNRTAFLPIMAKSLSFELRMTQDLCNNNYRQQAVKTIGPYDAPWLPSIPPFIHIDKSATTALLKLSLHETSVEEVIQLISSCNFNSDDHLRFELTKITREEAMASPLKTAEERKKEAEERKNKIKKDRLRVNFSKRLCSQPHQIYPLRQHLKGWIQTVADDCIYVSNIPNELPDTILKAIMNTEMVQRKMGENNTGSAIFKCPPNIYAGPYMELFNGIVVNSLVLELSTPQGSLTDAKILRMTELFQRKANKRKAEGGDPYATLAECSQYQWEENVNPVTFYTSNENRKKVKTRWGPALNQGNMQNDIRGPALNQGNLQNDIGGPALNQGNMQNDIGGPALNQGNMHNATGGQAQNRGNMHNDRRAQNRGNMRNDQRAQNRGNMQNDRWGPLQNRGNMQQQPTPLLSLNMDMNPEAQLHMMADLQVKLLEKQRELNFLQNQATMLQRTIMEEQQMVVARLRQQQLASAQLPMNLEEEQMAAAIRRQRHLASAQLPMNMEEEQMAAAIRRQQHLASAQLPMNVEEQQMVTARRHQQQLASSQLPMNMEEEQMAAAIRRQQQLASAQLPMNMEEQQMKAALFRHQQVERLDFRRPKNYNLPSQGF